MKTATVAILASCLLGQALAAPVKSTGAEIPTKAGDLTKDIKIDDLKSALKDVAQEARAVRYGTPAKRGDDKIKDVLSALGIDAKDLDKKTVKLIEKGIKDLTDASKTPLTRLTDLSNMVQVLQPYYKKATVSKRSTKEVDTLLGNLGVDAKDLDKKTLKKVEDKVKQVADKTADPIVRAGGLGDILSILGPLLDGAEEQTQGPTDTATGLAGGAAGNNAGSLPTGNLPVKRLVDGSILKNLFNIIGLETGDDDDEAEGGVKDVAGDVTGKAGGLLDSVTKNLPGGLGDALPLPIKRSSDLGPLKDLLKSLGLDGTLKGVTDKAGGAVGGATDKLPLPKRQLDGLTDLLDLLGLGGDDTDDETASGVTDTAGPVLGGVTGAVPGLGKRQLDGLSGLLEGLLGGDEDSASGATDAVGSTVGGLTDTASGVTGGVPGLGKRQLDGLSGLLEGLTGGNKGNPLDAVTGTAGGLVDTVGSTADSLTGGATAPLTSTAGGLADTATGLASGAAGAVPGLGKRQLDAVTGVLGGLTGGSKGSPLDAVTGTAGGLVDTVGSTADSLTGGATAPLTSTAGDLVGNAGGLASGAAGAVPGLGKRMAPGSPDLAALLQALGPVLDQLKGASDGATGAASGVTDAADEVAPIPTPAAAPKPKRQAVPPPAPEDIVPADLPETGTEPLTVIFDDLTEVSSLLPGVGESIPGADALRETIDKFLASLGGLASGGAAPEAPLPIETPEPLAAAGLP